MEWIEHLSKTNMNKEKNSVSNNLPTSLHQECGNRAPVSTKINPGNDKYENIRTDSLLRMKETWPGLFTDVCQQYLNSLQLGLDRQCLWEAGQNKRSRTISDMVRMRSRSRSRERSLSPNRIGHLSDSKWNMYSEVSTTLIDNLLDNLEKLPDTFLSSKVIRDKTKVLLNEIISCRKESDKVKLIRNSDPSTAGELLMRCLQKLDVLVPTPIGQLLHQVGSMLCHTNGKPVHMKRRIIAVQILLLNVPARSRSLLKRTAALLHAVNSRSHIKTSLNELSSILAASLFGRDCNFLEHKIAADLIELSEKAFRSPRGILEVMKSNTDNQSVAGPFAFPTAHTIQKPSPSLTSARLENFFPHSKAASVFAVRKPPSQQNVQHQGHSNAPHFAADVNQRIKVKCHVGASSLFEINQTSSRRVCSPFSSRPRDTEE